MAQAHSSHEPPLYFICYRRAYDALAEKIESKLASRTRKGQIKLFRDVKSIDAGDEFTPNIQAAIAEASGAIVFVGDGFYDSDYIQDIEWPALLARKVADDDFRFFFLAVTRLAKDDEIVDTYSFVHEITEALSYASDEVRDTALTALTDKIGEHVKRIRPAVTATPTAAPTAGFQRNLAPAPGGPQLCPKDLRPGIFGVPDVPSMFVAPDEVEQLTEQLLSHSVSAITGLRGEGGAGKSVLAAHVARSLTVQMPGGVHWVTVGEKATDEDVRQMQQNLLESLGAPPERVADVNEGRRLLAAALQQRRALVIVDDLWHPWQTQAFDVVGQASTARLLLTTRFAESLPAGSVAIDLGRIGLEAATTFLEQAAGSLPDKPQQLAAVLETAGGLRLALAVISATVRVERTWAGVISRLPGLEKRFGSGDDASSAHKALHIAVGSLTSDERTRLWQLAVLPVDQVVSLSLLGRLWKVEPAETASIVDRLIALELAGWSGKHIQVHDHVHDFVVLQIPGPVQNLHLWLWHEAQRLADGDWTRLRGIELYLWERLVWHGCRAGLNTATLTGVPSDQRWLSARVFHDGPTAAEQDVREICDVTGATPNSPLRQLQRVLRHGSLFTELPNEQSTNLSLKIWCQSLGMSS